MKTPNPADQQARWYALNPRSVWQAFVLGVLGLVCLIGVDMFHEHALIDADERKQLTTQATVVDDNLTHSLMSVNAAIDALSHDLPSMLAERVGSLLVDSRLHALVDVLIGIRTLVILNADGVVVASNQNVLIGQNYREGERFQTICQENDPAKLVVSPPFTTPLGIYAISVGKKTGGRQRSLCWRGSGHHRP